MARGLPNLRNPRAMAALRRAFAEGKRRFGFRLVHFSVQRGHVHLMCEAEDKEALSRGLQGLSVRVARGLNRALGRRGRVFGDRYHAQVLSTPTQVRWALGYVLCNTRRHNAQLLTPVRYARGWLDTACSSAAYFPGWHDGGRAVPCRDIDESAPVTAAETFLLGRGWLRLGKLPTDHVPG
jgi:REP element-mobilizing transposase RayT